jgi:hypothetical protein
MTGRFLAPALLSCAVALACSSTPDKPADAGAAPSCPVAATCPDGGVPSYQTEILPILQEACLPCHSPGGTAGYNENSYEDVYNQRSPILDQVYDCLMPPTNGPQLTSAQRVALTGWLECGAPNN